MKFIILMFLVVNLFAQDDYSFRVAYGKVSGSNLDKVLIFQNKDYEYGLKVLALDGGYILKSGAFDSPMDIYIKLGFSRFFEDSTQDDVYERNLYFKAYWNFDFSQNRVRFGFGEGLSYVNSVLIFEYLEGIQEEDGSSKFLNYLDISWDVDIGMLTKYKPLYGTTLGWAIKHRSGIYGLINGVKHSGSNYNTIYIEKNF